MKLYHGTSQAALDGILADGIKPRGKRGRSNWTHSVESNPNCVYLCEGYGMHFAVHAANEIGGPHCAIIEIDSKRLNFLNLLPDEDAIEQTNRGKDTLPKKWDMKKRTRHYRKRMENYAGQHDVSLKALGTCCYLGIVPVSAITRVAAIDLSQNPSLRFASDPTISLMNHRIMGGYYRQLTSVIFGDGVDTGDDLFPDYAKRLAQLPRDGVVVTTINQPASVAA